MGKKVQIVSSDPILSKNYKYEKRAKNRLIEKAKTQEEKALELKRKRELIEIERKVDAQIEQATANLPALLKSQKIADIKKQMLDKKNKQASSQLKVNTNVPELELSTLSKIQDAYQYHFGLLVSERQLIREKRKSNNQQIEQETKKEIKQMFNFNNEKLDPKEQEQMEEQLSDELLNLALQCKKETQLCITSQVFHVTNNFHKHKEVLGSLPSEQLDTSLVTAKMLIDGYFDHVYIENSQEEKIEAFRQIVIDHSIAHLQRTLEEQKGRGFTNCKILILAPFVGDARAILDTIQQKFPQYEINNKEKLEEIQDENDFFRIGIKIAKKKKQLTYFSNFDHSEIIIASPVGLKSIIGSEGDQKRQNSFISSVEIVYIDRASVLLMQNWAHLVEIFSNMNIMPRYDSLKNSIDTIRDSFLELKGRLFRQSIVFSEFNFPELNALKRFHFHNIQGGATSKVFYPKPATTLSNHQQHFYKIQLKEPKDDLNMRFEYFKKKFWDDLHNKQTLTKVVLFTNSYFQFVKLKSFLQKVNASADFISQHTKKNKVQSRLAKFNEGQFRILLTTERAFYFDVCQVKKFHSIYFYSLPKNAFIYQNLLGSIQQNETGLNRIVSIYTKFDMLIIEKIVGTAKALQMVREYCNNVSFVI